MDKVGFTESYDKTGVIEEVAKKLEKSITTDDWPNLNLLIESLYKAINDSVLKK
jgi:hypothetical protein